MAIAMTAFPSIDLARTGKRIETVRKSRGLSVRDIQEYFGFEYPQAVYKWQHGECLPSVDNLFALARLLRVNMDDLLVAFGSEDQEVPHLYEKTGGTTFPSGAVFCLFLFLSVVFCFIRDGAGDWVNAVPTAPLGGVVFLLGALAALLQGNVGFHPDSSLQKFQAHPGQRVPPAD